MNLSTMVISAVVSGKITFDTDLPEPRYCKIGELEFVRPVVGGENWCLVVGRGFDHVSISKPAHWALEYARMGWQSAMKGGQA